MAKDIVEEVTDVASYIAIDHPAFALTFEGKQIHGAVKRPEN